MAAIIRASYAFSFNLLNKDGDSVIGIFDDKKGQTATLQIINTSRRDLRLKTLNAANASATNHHFELKFRPGTLNTTAPITIDPGAGQWRISAPTPTEEGVSLYLLSTKPGVIDSGQVTSLTLQNLNAERTGGARGTRVELKWKAGCLEYLTNERQPEEDLVGGHRVKYVDIVNAQGQQYIPLHVGFFGTNQVLNDGSANTLKLRLTNVLKPNEGDIKLVQPGHPELSATQLIFSFESSNKEWTLGSVADVKFESLETGKKFSVKVGAQADAPVWVLEPLQLISLKPGEFIDVTIKDVKTTQQPGPTNLKLHYKNIPGYWDGDFVSVIEKSQVIYKEQRVGVGTTEPREKLHVAGKMRVENEVSANSLKIDKHREILFAEHGQIRSVDDGHRIMFHQTQDKLEFRERGQIIFSPGSASGEETAQVVMKSDGRVGIGEVEPATHLHVKGGGDQQIMIESTADGGRKWGIQSSGTAGRFEIVNRNPNEVANCLTILPKGNVGIGTVDPKTKLHVKGDVRIGGEILLEDSSRIKCFDNNHLIEFTRGYQFDDSKLEIRDTGKIIFSPGAKQGVGTDKVVITHEGRVGIGTPKPTNGMLEIVGSVSNLPLRGYWFMNHGGTNKDHDNKQFRPYSIWASDRIACEEFNAVSDERIKNIQGRSNGAADLCTLLGIEVTDYTYRDVIGKGTRAHKKLIGQQIERVFPQAVSRTTDAVPDIYQPALIRDGWVSLATDLEKGERVKLMTEKGERLHEVLAVADGKFLVDLQQEDDKVFVYGREVDDFLTVDYDAVAMLNVSATQQLKKEMDQEVKMLRAENAELRAANDALAKRLELLESKLEATLGVMTAAAGANGNGRH